MFIKVTEQNSGENKDRKVKSFRIMESARKGSKTVQKTIRFVGSSANPDVIKVLEQLAQKVLMELRNDRQPALPHLMGYKKHYKVHHGKNEFAKKEKKKIRNHINGIENFWGLAKVRLSKFRGMNKYFYLSTPKYILLAP